MVNKPKIMIDEPRYQQFTGFRRRILQFVFKGEYRLFQLAELEGPQFPLNVQNTVQNAVHRQPLGERRARVSERLHLRDKALNETRLQKMELDSVRALKKGLAKEDL